MFCFQEIEAEISIFVISTDPSVTILMRCGHVVLERCYQLFINNPLKFSRGQLKEKQFYWRHVSVSLSVYKLPACVRRRHIGFFPLWAGMQNKSIEDQLVNRKRIISVHFENHSNDISRAGMHKSRRNQFCRVAPNNWASLVWNTLHVNLLTPNDDYSGRTAPLTSKRCILCIYSTNIGTAYFKHGIYYPFFPL